MDMPFRKMMKASVEAAQEAGYDIDFEQFRDAYEGIWREVMNSVTDIQEFRMISIPYLGKFKVDLGGLNRQLKRFRSIVQRSSHINKARLILVRLEKLKTEITKYRNRDDNRQIRSRELPRIRERLDCKRMDREHTNRKVRRLFKARLERGNFDPPVRT